jgi:hypothetical protein
MKRRTSDHIHEADDRRKRKSGIGRINIPGAVLNDLCLTAIDKHNGAACLADIYRLIVLVQNQYRAV